MAHQWRGVIREYADRLPMLSGSPVVTLHEGGTPLIAADHLSELVGATVLVVVFSPLLLATAVAIRVHDGGPVFFRQQRVGRSGDLFDLYKFRSMTVGADAMLETLAEHNRHDEDHVLFKAESDPRVTAPGRVIRRFSLDEMPQFLNVLRGEMSLVGPRPMMPEQQGLYPGEAYFRLRPGLTGLWQVSERNRTSFAERAEFIRISPASSCQSTPFRIGRVSSVLAANDTWLINRCRSVPVTCQLSVKSTFGKAGNSSRGRPFSL